MTTTRNLQGRTQSNFLTDVLRGLSRAQKAIPPKYFYDDLGSKLFDQICELPEYYPTRTELGILAEYGAAMARSCGPRVRLVELGAGSLKKVRFLLDHLEQPSGFAPVDVSGPHLRAASLCLQRDYPTVPVYPVVADFTKPFSLPEWRAPRTVAFFPGSTLGNLDALEADLFLSFVADLVGPAGGLLLGVDLQKAVSTLEAAYNDRAGVTAAFNKNLLTRINRELAGNFDLNQFDHLAWYNPVEHRIEMHLVSRDYQTVTVAGQEFDFRPGETIHTENSHKYQVRQLAQRAWRCGWEFQQAWTDPQEYFAVLELRARPRN